MMPRQQGMTLLEVLLAMAIFSAAALTLLISMQGMMNASDKMQMQTLASWVADNQLLALPVTNMPLPMQSEGMDKQTGIDFPWQMTLVDSEQRIATVQVTLPNGQLFTLHGAAPITEKRQGEAK